MEETLNYLVQELTNLIAKHQTVHLRANSLSLVLATQILGEAKEYLKILEMAAKYLKQSGHVLLKKGLPRASVSVPRNAQNTPQSPTELPTGFNSKQHLEEFLQFMNSYMRRT